MKQEKKQSISPCSQKQTLRANSSKKKPKSTSTRLKVAGILLICLLLLGYWQRVFIAQKVINALASQLEKQEIYFSANIDEISLSKGFVIEKITLYKDSNHSVPLLNASQITLKPLISAPFSAKISFQESTIQLYHPNKEILPLTIHNAELLLSSKKSELRHLKAQTGKIEITLDVATYDFSSSESRKKPRRNTRKTSDFWDSSLGKKLTQLSFLQQWDVAQNGSIKAHLSQMDITPNSFELEKFQLHINQASLPQANLDIHKLEIQGSSPKLNSLHLSLQGEQVTWDSHLWNQPFSGTVQIQPKRTSFEISSSQVGLTLRESCLFLDHFHSKGSWKNHTLTAELSSSTGTIGAIQLPGLEANLRRYGQKLDAQVTTISAPESATQLQADLTWHGNAHVLEFHQIQNTLPSWEILRTVFGNKSLFGTFQTLTPLCFSGTNLVFDFSDNFTQIYGDLAIHPIQGYWPDKKIPFSLNASTLHFDQRSLSSNFLTGTLFDGPFHSSVTLDWTHPKEVFLDLQDLQIQPDISQITPFYEKFSPIEIELKGNPQLSFESVSIPLLHSSHSKISAFHIDEFTQILLKHPNFPCIPIYLRSASGKLNEDQLYLDTLSADAFSGTHQLHEVTVDLTTTQKQIHIAKGYTKQLNLQQITPFLPGFTEQNSPSLLGKITFEFENFGCSFHAPYSTYVDYFSLQGEDILLFQAPQTPSLAIQQVELQGKYHSNNLTVHQALFSTKEEGFLLANNAIFTHKTPLTPHLEIQSLQAKNFPLAPLAELLDSKEKWNFTLQGNSTAKIKQLSLPFSCPAQSQLAYFHEAGSIQLNFFPMKEENTSWEFLIEEAQGSYLSKQLHVKNARGLAFSSPCVIKQGQMLWHKEHPIIIAEKIQVAPHLNSLSQLFNLKKYHLQMAGNPTWDLDQLAVDFGDLSTAHISSFTQQGTISANVKVSQDRWLPFLLQSCAGSLTEKTLQLFHLQGELFTGHFFAENASLSWKEDPVFWSVDLLNLEDIDLTQFAQWHRSKSVEKMQGFLSANLRATGGLQLSELSAQIQAEVYEGHFYAFPIFGPLHFLLTQLIPTFPQDVASEAFASMSIENSILSLEEVVTLSSASEMRLLGAINLQDQETLIDGTINLRSFAGIATFFLSEALRVQGKGPLNDMEYSFLYLPLPNSNQLDQLQQLPSNFLNLPGVRELKKVQQIPILGDTISTINNVRSLPLLRSIPFLGHDPDELEEEPDSRNRPGLFDYFQQEQEPQAPPEELLPIEPMAAPAA